MNESKKTKVVLILIFASVGSNILGMLRNHFFTEKIPTAELASYYAAFRIPDLLFNLLVLGILSSVFITFFVEHLHKDNKTAAFRFANNLINFTIILLSLTSLLLFFLMPYLADLITPGFSEEAKNLTTRLAQLMLFSPIIFGLSSIAGGMLNSFKKFTAYSLAPLFYNVGIIFGTIFLTPIFGTYGLAYGVLIGAVLHLLTQLPTVFKLGFRYQPVLDFKDHSLKEILRLAPPRIGGLMANQANFFILTIIGSIIGGGSIAYLNLANDIQTFVTVVFGLSFATAIFPILTEKISTEKNDEFIDEFSMTFRQILFFTIPASLGLILLRGQIVRLILGYGFFNIIDTKLTAAVLGVFAFSLFSQALIPLIVRAFYALKDTKTPFFASTFAVFINLLGSLTLPQFFRNYSASSENNITFAVVGLAVAFSIASFVNMMILLFSLHKRLGRLNEGKIFNSLGKILLATGIMGLCVQSLKYLVSPIINPEHPVIGFAAQTILVVFVGILVYAGLAHLLKCEELRSFKKIFRNVFKKSIVEKVERS